MVQPWEKVKLKVPVEKELLKATILNTYLPNSTKDSNDYMLNLDKAKTQANVNVNVNYSPYENLKKADYKISYTFDDTEATELQTKVQTRGEQVDKR